MQTISTKLMLLLIGLKLRWTQFVFMSWVPPVNLEEIEFERNWVESDEKMAFRVGYCNFSTNCCQYSSKIHKTFQRGEFLLIFFPKVFLEQPFPHLFLLTNVLAESDYEGGRLLGMGMVSQVQDGQKNKKDKNITTNQIMKGENWERVWQTLQCWDFTDPSSHKMSQSDNRVYIKIFCAVHIWIR